MRALFVLLSIFCAIFATAQDLTVRSMEALPFDTYASVHKRLDLNQNPCAVVRVSLPVNGATFSGNVIGDVARDGSDYLVYMPAGSKKIWVKHPNFHELEVVFGNYGIERLESLATYRVTVNVPQRGMGYEQDDGLTYFVLSVEPKTALVTIDGNQQPVDANGEYSLLMSRSTHTYEVSAGGYESKKETFILGTERKNVNVSLESNMASLSVVVQTAGAALFINEQQRGTTSWSGKLPPGNYKVEARLEGYYPQSETVTLAAREEKTLTLPVLMARTGSLNVSYKPNNSEVWIDGRRAGLSPDIFKDLSLGSHKVSIRKEGYATKDITATIAENQTATLSGTLEQLSPTVTVATTTTSAPGTPNGQETSAASPMAQTTPPTTGNGHESSAASPMAQTTPPTTGNGHESSSMSPITQTNPSATGIHNGHEYVDLGLSVKWATCNVGANSQEDYGDYFAWGETSPKSEYTWENLKYHTKGKNWDKFSKYVTRAKYGRVDNKTVLEPEDDAAYANWGGSWRMPTQAEFQELVAMCTWTRTMENGKSGYKVISKVNGNCLFLPAAGDRNGTSLTDAGSHGTYWSSSLDESHSGYAWVLYFDSGGRGRSYGLRYFGQSVRPVCE